LKKHQNRLTIKKTTVPLQRRPDKPKFSTQGSLFYALLHHY